MVWAREIERDEWVRNEVGQVALFCRKCGDEVDAEHIKETDSFLYDCDSCGTGMEVEVNEADFYQPIW